MEGLRLPPGPIFPLKLGRHSQLSWEEEEEVVVEVEKRFLLWKPLEGSSGVSLGFCTCSAAVCPEYLEGILQRE